MFGLFSGSKKKNSDLRDKYTYYFQEQNLTGFHLEAKTKASEMYSILLGKQIDVSDKNIVTKAFIDPWSIGYIVGCSYAVVRYLEILEFFERKDSAVMMFSIDAMKCVFKKFYNTESIYESFEKFTKNRDTGESEYRRGFDDAYQDYELWMGRKGEDANNMPFLLADRHQNKNDEKIDASYYFNATMSEEQLEIAQNTIDFSYKILESQINFAINPGGMTDIISRMEHSIWSLSYIFGLSSSICENTGVRECFEKPASFEYFITIHLFDFCFKSYLGQEGSVALFNKGLIGIKSDAPLPTEGFYAGRNDFTIFHQNSHRNGNIMNKSLYEHHAKLDA